MVVGPASVAFGWYNFDTDNEGWQESRIGYYGRYYEQRSGFVPAGWTADYGVGSPDGSLFQASYGSSFQDRPYGFNVGVALAQYGDLTGKTLKAYIRSTANWRAWLPTDKVYLRWTIGSAPDSNGRRNLWVSKSAYSIDLNDPVFGSGSDSEWVYKTIELTEDKFFQWPNTSNGGSFASLMTSYTSFSLSILPTDGSDAVNLFNGQSGTWGSNWTLLHFGATAQEGTGNAVLGVDGFGVVPGPAAALPFLGGLLMALKRRRR